MPFFGSKLDGTAQFSLLHEVAGLEYEHLDPLEFLFLKVIYTTMCRSESIHWVPHSSYFDFANKTRGAHSTLLEVLTTMLLKFITFACFQYLRDARLHDSTTTVEC
jgi:hypothetical protein